MSGLGFINQEGCEGLGRFYSKYRGVVLDNTDPDNLGRILVVVPSVNNELAEWAFPAVFQGSPNSGMKYITPSLGETVWVEFECGDPMYPIWSYCGWAMRECPEELKDTNSIGFITPSGNKVILKDSEGIMIISIVDSSGKELSNISIEKDIVKVKAKEIRLQTGGQGIVLTDKLVNQLNKIEDELSNLKTTIVNASNAVVPEDGGKSAFGVLSSWSSKKITKTVMKDIENTQIFQNES